MFDFVKRRLKKTEERGSSEAKATEHNVGEVVITEERPTKKKCPKCHKSFPVEMVVCPGDKTLLMLVQQNPFAITNLDAKKPDGSEWKLQCMYIGSGSICDVFLATEAGTKAGTVAGTVAGTEAGTETLTPPAPDCEDRQVFEDYREQIDKKAEYVVKVLRPALRFDAKSEQRFMQGCETGLTLTHKNIARIYATGLVDEGKKTQRPYAIFERLTDHPLSELLEKGNIPTTIETVSIAREVCAALEYAHSHGIVHGDLKPSNIYFKTEDNQIVTKVSDFGVAERLFRELTWDRVATLTVNIYGCAAYLSPEYAFKRILTPASDIYSLGCIMYECLTGQPPFLGNNDFATIMLHVHEPAPELPRKTVSKGVWNIVKRALEKNPKDRWQSAGEMREALEKALK